MGDNPVRDAVRDRWLGMRGLRVMRFLASDVMKDVEPVLKSILGACGRT
jgi:very-short-patch-repair endonuclease